MRAYGLKLLFLSLKVEQAQFFKFHKHIQSLVDFVSQKCEKTEKIFLDKFFGKHFSKIVPKLSQFSYFFLQFWFFP